MLEFFRKYQKYFFVLIAVVTIISFTFYGTYSTISALGTHVINRPLGKTVEGETIYERDVKGLSGLLDRSGLTNGLLENDLIAPGIADLLVHRFFANIRKDLEARLKKVQAYRPYAHPGAPFLKAEAIWNHFAPEINDNLKTLKSKTDEVKPETFSLLTKLYAAQAQFPQDMLKRVIAYQQNQFSWMPQDENLIHENLGLFHFQTAQDWFGNSFCYIVSEFLLNAADYAQQKGYEVTKEEAFADLLQNAHQALGGQETSYDQAIHYIDQEFYSCGLQHSEGIEIWRRVMLFRRLYNDVGGAILLDPLLQKQFNAYAQEKATIQLYQLPEELRFRNFREMLKFQFYIEAVSGKTKSLNLPTNFISAEKLSEKYPELLKRSCLIEVASVSKEDLLSNISLKETWEWELDQGNWDVLKREFPVLSHQSTASRDERFAQLEKLDSNTRFKVDHFVQEKIAEQHPEWIDQALAQKEMKKTDPRTLEGIEDLNEFYAALTASDEIAKFTQDNDHYFHIRVIEKPNSMDMLSFKEANQEGILDDLLDKRLEAAYLEIRKKEPSVYQVSEGNWKPFSQVRDLVGSKVYADLLKAIEDKHSFDKTSLDNYANHRLHSFVKDQLEQKSEKHPIWNLVKSEHDIEKSSGAMPDAFILAEGGFSGVQVGKQGDISFYQLVKRSFDENSHSLQSEGRILLVNEARRNLTRQLLGLIAERNAIDLSILIAGEG